MSVPYWLINNKNHGKYDVAIIGAGISGIGTAYWLNKLDPKLKVIVLDRGLVGSGATTRNAGFISMGSLALFGELVDKHGIEKAVEIRKFYKLNHELFRSELDLNEIDYKKNGSVSLSFSEKRAEQYDLLASTLNTEGFDISRVKTPLIPNTEGFLDSEDGSCHSTKLLNNLQSKCKAKIVENCEVFKVEDDLIYSSQGNIQADKIVYCLNGYSNLLSNVPSLISPVRGQIMVLESGKNVIPHNMYASENKCYFRELPDGSVLFGGFRTLDPHNEVGFDDSFTTPIIQNALLNFSQSIPHLSGRKVIHSWAGIMGFSKDHLAIVKEFSSNQYLIGGYTGHGMGQAFACAKVLAENIVSSVIIPAFLTENK